MKNILFLLFIPFLISCTASRGSFDDGTNGSSAINTGILSDDGTTAFVASFYQNEAPVISKNLKEKKSENSSIKSNSSTVSVKNNNNSSSISNSSDSDNKPALQVVEIKSDSAKDKSSSNKNKTENNSSSKTSDKKPSKELPLFLYPVEDINIKKDFASSGSDKNTGIDFNVGNSEKIYASAKGIVIFAGEKNSLGKSVFIYHDKGYISIYYNLSSISVSKGSSVPSSDFVVGTASSSFHFEIRKQNSSGVEVLNPKNILQKRRK